MGDAKGSTYVRTYVRISYTYLRLYIHPNGLNCCCWIGKEIIFPSFILKRDILDLSHHGSQPLLLVVSHNIVDLNRYKVVVLKTYYSDLGYVFRIRIFLVSQAKVSTYTAVL